MFTCSLTRKRIFIAAVFVIAPNWKLPEYSSIVEWVDKLWEIHIMDYYTAMRINNLQSSKTRKTLHFSDI